MNYRLISEWRTLLLLKSQWKQLHQQCHGTVFSSFEWCEQQFKLAAAPVVVIIERDDQVLFILPLNKKQLSNKIPVDIYQHLCARFSDYQEILISQRTDRFKVIEFFWRSVVPELDSFNLKIECPSIDKNTLLFTNHCDSGKIKYSRTEHIQFIDFKQPYATSKVFAEIRRRKKKLFGDFTSQICIASRLTQELFKDIMHLSRQQHGENPLNASANLSPHWQLFDVLHTQVECSYILIDKKLVAAHLGFIQGDDVFYYVPVHEKTYAKYGLGFILLEEIIQHYKQQGFSRVNFLRGDEGYKEVWSNQVEQRAAMLFVTDAQASWKKALIAAWIYRQSM